MRKKRKRIIVDLDRHKTEEVWFATSKQLPGIEGKGSNSTDAFADFLSRAPTIGVPSIITGVDRSAK